MNSLAREFCSSANSEFGAVVVVVVSGAGAVWGNWTEAEPERDPATSVLDPAAMDFFKKASASFGGGAGESDLMKQAGGFLGSTNSTTESPAPTATPTTAAAPASEGNYSEVYGSAQTLYQGLQDKLSGKESTIADQELAGAAKNVLKAAENAGLAKDSQYGAYFTKAESYLDNYGQPKTAATSELTSEAPTSEALESEAPTSKAPTSEELTSEAPTSVTPTSEAASEEAAPPAKAALAADDTPSTVE